MKTEKLILNYQRRGIKLSVSDNKLHFSAPQNILTDEDKDILKKNKKEIIKFLLDHTESEIIVDEEDKYEKFPLTDIQLSYLVGQDNVYKFGGTNCKIYTEIEYEQIELNKAQYAWEQVIKYNDMLHAVINQEGTQEILSSYTVPQIVFSDLSDMENAEVIIAQKRESLTKKQYRVGTWPLFDVEITKLKNKYILHISLDMLVADFVSINVILNEFEEVYYNGKLSFKGSILEFPAEGTREDVIEYLLRLEMFDEAIVKNKVFLDYYIPMLRADCNMLATYQYRSHERMSCDFDIWYGKEDKNIHREKIEKWRECTNGNVKIEEMAGGHFFVDIEKQCICEMINQKLLEVQ